MITHYSYRVVDITTRPGLNKANMMLAAGWLSAFCGKRIVVLHKPKRTNRISG